MGFLNTLFGGKRERSSDVARERLLKVLVDDRIKLTPMMLAQMKAELSAVVAKYVPGESSLIRSKSRLCAANRAIILRPTYRCVAPPKQDNLSACCQ